MNVITRDYLAAIIFRIINKTIAIHRATKTNSIYNETYPPATDAEILDFVHSIPYFDERLKNFIVGNLPDEAIIVSQAWEIEFIKRSQAWAEGCEWLNRGDGFVRTRALDISKDDLAFLTLPY